MINILMNIDESLSNSDGPLLLCRLLLACWRSTSLAEAILEATSNVFHIPQYSIKEILPQFQYNFYGPRWSKTPLLSLVASYVQCLVLVYAWTSLTIHNFAPSWQDNRKRHIASCQLHSVAKNKLAWRCKDSTTGKNPQ